MKKSEYAEYLRQRHYASSTELSKSLGKSKHDYEEMIKRQSDDEIISSYLFCSCCGYEILSVKEMESILSEAISRAKQTAIGKVCPASFGFKGIQSQSGSLVNPVRIMH